MVIKENKEILLLLSQTIEKHGIRKCKIAEFLGYKGTINIQSMAMRRILYGEREFMIWHLNGMAEFLRYPAGFFLFGESDSHIQKIDEGMILQKIRELFNREDLKPRKTRKTRTQFGKYLRYSDNVSSQFNTARAILNESSKLRVDYIQHIADFFEKDVEYFILP